MTSKKTDSFNLHPGRQIGRRYVVEAVLGVGSEGEVYRVRDRGTGITRAAKIFFPHRDPDQRLSVRHAQKLNRLRRCPIVLQYHHTEEVTIRGVRTTAVISELCDGEPLAVWINAQRGRRLTPFMALTILHSLAVGLEQVHAMGEYHADVHTENILVKPHGVVFDLKLIDFYEWGRPTRPKMQQDVLDAVKVFYDMLGGRRHYAKQPAEVKRIVAGLKTTLILERFPSMTALRGELETFEWRVMK
jgi:RIO-like serine/threonine protein kinase